MGWSDALEPRLRPAPPSRQGKLVLVDLAGSERLKESGSSGPEAVRETGSINRSLFTLGQVRVAGLFNREEPTAPTVRRWHEVGGYGRLYDRNYLMIQ